jgi:hypothetical protein
MARIALGIALLLTATATLAQEPARMDGWVVLSLAEYRDLRSRAFPAPPDPAPPPIDSVLTRVDYDLRAGADVATGQAHLIVDVLKEGWVTLQVPSGLMIRNARLDGRPAALLSGSPPRMLISRPGRSLITLDVVVPLSSTAGVESMTLPSAGSALSSVRLTIPRAGVDLTASGGLVTEHAETAAVSRWTVHGTPLRAMAFSWKRRVDDRRGTLALRARARITQMVSLGEETSLVNASLQTEVIQGTARQIVVAIPEGLTVNQVSGPAVGDWVQDAGTLSVSLLEPTTTGTTISIAAEVRLPRDGAITIPIFSVPGADRESGGVAVDVLGAGEIGARQMRGLEPADPSELGGVVAGRESPSMAAFRFGPLERGAARALTVNVTRYKAKPVLIANIEEARYDAVMGEDGKMLVRARYAVRNNQRSFLAVTLPDSAIVWSAALAGQPIRPGVTPSGALLLPLQKGRAGEDAPMFGVELVYLNRIDPWTDKGRARVPVPALDLPVSRTGLTMHHSPRYRIDVRPGVFRVENDPGPGSAVLRRDDVISLNLAPTPRPGLEPDAAARAATPPIQSLIDQVRKDSGRSVPGVVPVQIALPEFGLPLFVAAELTPEGVAPALEIDYRRTADR